MPQHTLIQQPTFATSYGLAVLLCPRRMGLLKNST
jgi:hypothetical protein